MTADFELKPTRTYDAAELREMLRSLPNFVVQDADGSPPPGVAADASFADAQAPVLGGEADEAIDRYLAEDRGEAPTSSFAAWRAHFAAEREREQARADDQVEDQAAFAAELDDHGRAEAERGAYGVARALIEKAVEIRRRLHGERDPKLVRSFSWLGSLALLQGEVEQAEWLYNQAHTAAEQQYGPDHVRTGATLHNLGVVAQRRGQLEQAADLYERALAIKLQQLGWDHPSVAATLTNLGNLSRLQQDFHNALQLYARAREIYERTLGGANSGLATALVGMGRVYLKVEQFDEARFVLERALRIREALQVAPMQLAGSRLLLAHAIRGTEPAQALALVQRALREYEASPDPRPAYVDTLRTWVERFAEERRAA